MLDIKNPRVEEVFRLLDIKHPYKVGVDNCNVPGAIQFYKNVFAEAVDTCEGGCLLMPEIVVCGLINK